MHARSIAVLTGLLLLAPALAAPPSGAQADRGEREPDRRVDVSSEDRRVEVSLLPPEEASDEAEPVHVRWATANATLRLVHGTGAEQLGLEIRLGPLVEFEDENGNGTFDPGEPIASVWALAGNAEDDEDVNGTASWSDAVVANATRGGKQGKRVTVPAALGEGASLRLRLEALGQHAQLPNTTLTPTGAKLDLEIESFPYQRNASQLALFVAAEASQAREVNRQHSSFTQAEEGVVVTPEGTPAALMIAWRDTARVDGRALPVATSEMAPGVEDTPSVGQPERDANVTERQFALGYARGTVIEHDLRTDVATASATQNGAPGPPLAALLAALAAAGTLRRRPRTGSSAPPEKSL